MTLKELLKDDIMERYANREYYNIEIVENMIAESNTNIELLLLKLEEENIISYIGKDSSYYEMFQEKTIDIVLDGEFTFDNCDDFALILRTGVEIVDIDNNLYIYDKELLNPYRIHDNNENEAITDWSFCNEHNKFRLNDY